MRVALIGYGKMGKAIEKVALLRGYEITARVRSGSWDPEGIVRADVCMEFTEPASAVDNISRLARMKKEIVIGTTGWDDRVDTVRRIVEEEGTGAVYGSNFSIGIHLFCACMSYVSRLMDRFEEYDPAGIDLHHKDKKDAPSGTALMIADIVRANMKRVDSVPFTSVREGDVAGTHTVRFDSPRDTLSLSHQAKNREGFAVGALQGAEWLSGKKGLYLFSDFLAQKINAP
ncbi:MAG: 4-hydroxy-tetrahydrodipicolinate reductase [Simkaniaceae bacterium]|nr:4-hydroxy-tetrahydrodipicolinate reductase [Simkaniaceae bacterium]